MLVPAGWVREVLPVPGPVAGDRAPPTRCPPLPSDVSLSGSFPLLAAEEASGCSLFHAQRAASAAAFPSVPPAARTKAGPAGALRPLPAAPAVPPLTSQCLGMSCAWLTAPAVTAAIH